MLCQGSIPPTSRHAKELAIYRYPTLFVAHSDDKNEGRSRVKPLRWWSHHRLRSGVEVSGTMFRALFVPSCDGACKPWGHGRVSRIVLLTHALASRSQAFATPLRHGTRARPSKPQCVAPRLSGQLCGIVAYALEMFGKLPGLTSQWGSACHAELSWPVHA